GLVERGVVVVAGGVGLVGTAEIGPGPESERSAAVSHVEIAGDALREHPVHPGGGVFRRGSVVALAPVIEPAVPVLGAETRAGGAGLAAEGVERGEGAGRSVG